MNLETNKCYSFNVSPVPPMSTVLKNATLTCSLFETALGNSAVICDDGVHYEPLEEPLNYKQYRFWMYLGGYVGLVLFAGLMSGLTLAIFSLDLTSLRVLQVAGSELDKKYAERIMPLAQRPYLVLVSLVLANSLAVEAMPLLLDRVSSPYIAILVSVTAVLIVGEVLPQAICSRFGLIIGYLFSWLVWSLIIVLYVVAYPISLLLDLVLGKRYGTFYRRAELKALVDIHGPQPQQQQKNQQQNSLQKSATVTKSSKKKRVSLFDKPLPLKISEETVVEGEKECLTIDEVLIIKGALELTTKTAMSSMIKLEDVHMLSVDDQIDIETLQEILEIGHSRIPVYDKTRQNLVGVLLTRRLILVDPNRRVPVKEIIADKRYFYPVFWIEPDMPLYVLLNKFQEGRSTHMAFVRQKQADGSTQMIGLVTLEDVLEEILQEEIYDEIDALRESMVQSKKWYKKLGSLKSEKIWKRMELDNKHNIIPAQSIKSVKHKETMISGGSGETIASTLSSPNSSPLQHSSSAIFSARESKSPPSIKFVQNGHVGKK